MTMACEKWTDVLQISVSELSQFLHDFKRDDPITFCLEKERMKIMRYIKSFVQTKEQKSQELSSECMKNGDCYFKLKSYDKSLAHYTQSIFYAPKESSDLALGYVKRSLTLHLMGYYEESIHDIEMALLNGFITEKKFLLERAKELTLLEEYGMAEGILNHILNAQSADKYGYVKIDNSPNNFALRRKMRKNETEWKLPVVNNGSNSDFPYASNSLEVQYSESKGRHVVAKCDIEIGDVLFVEEPFAFVVTESCCSECCKNTVAPIPCLNCIDIHFCSLKCREAAWESYHKFECGFHDMLKETGVGHLALRILLKAASNFEDLKCHTQVLTNKTRAEKTDTRFSNNNYENLFHLETHAADINTEDFLQYSLTSTLLSLYLVYYVEYATKNDENIKQVGELVLHHLSQIICNAHAITAIKLTSKEGTSLVASEEQRPIASAIYPSVSILNHSCDPSIINCFHKSTLVVRACKKIKKGEEVFNSYGVHFIRLKRSERQKILKSQYHFNCRCISCSDEYDAYDVLNSLQCEKCKGPLVGELKDSRAAEEREDAIQHYICLSCNYSTRLDLELWATKREVNRLLQCGENKLYQENDVVSALDAYGKAWRAGRKIFYKYHKDLCYSASQIAQCLFLMGDYGKCIMFLKRAVLAVQGRFGKFSSELAFEAKKLGDVVNVYLESEDKVDDIKSMIAIGLEYYEKSVEIFRLLYGADHPIVDEIEGSKTWLVRSMKNPPSVA